MRTWETDKRSVAALFRLIQSRLDISAIGVFSCQGPQIRCLAATDEFHALSPGFASLSATQPTDLPAKIAGCLSQNTAQKLDPAPFGLGGGFAACMPVQSGGETVGFILFLDARRRWLGPKAAQGMRDAAELFASIAAPDPTPERQESAPVAATDKAAPPSAAALCRILPHHDAHRMIRRARADESRTGPVSVLLLDIDRFRSVNEALGTAAGDALLTITASRLEHNLGPSDNLARLEADRFLVLTTREADGLPDFASRLLDCVSAPTTIAGQTVSMQATIGLVGPAAKSLSAPILFMQADSALRRGKRDGGNRIVVHEPHLDALGQEQSRLELELGEAISSGQLSLAFQPYIDLRTGQIAGAEALLRWNHPDRGELQPASFIELAESSGQILSIGAWALSRALCDASEWLGDLKLSVNISALQFHQPDFIAQVDTALSQSGFPAERLELEITETVLLRNDPETIGRIRTLIARGIRIALDDFGTGYSALAYLARVPHHRIKIDRDFIGDLDNPHTSDLVRAIVGSALSQGVNVTAEGVETEEQLAAIHEMGFTHAQGFAVAAPLANPEELLRDRAREAIA